MLKQIQVLKKMLKPNFIILCSCFLMGQAQAQNDSTGQSSMFKDTLDQHVDFSRFLIEANGFLPIMMIMTEPALGGFGIGAGPLFLK